MKKADSTAKTAAPALVIHHVFLDTEVYRSLGHNLDNPLFRTLGDHIAARRLVLHVTDITLAEVERQLAEFVGEAATAMKNAQSQSGGWKKRFPDTLKGSLPGFDQAVVAQAAFKQLKDRVCGGWRATLHAATDVAAQQVFQHYFSRKPPFDKPGSKEFPDAFVVRSLEAWCKNNAERMYVSRCRSSPCLTCPTVPWHRSGSPRAGACRAWTT